MRRNRWHRSGRRRWARWALAGAVGVVVGLAGLAALGGCDGPGPVTPAEVRWRWRVGELVAVEALPGGALTLTVRCPAAPGDGGPVVARYRIHSREVREFERRDPFGRRDPLGFVAERRCEEARAQLSAP